MSRTAEDILEFDRLRELLRRQTTCAPGRRAIDALAFSAGRAALDATFALIAEPIAYRPARTEIGFIPPLNRGIKHRRRIPNPPPPTSRPLAPHFPASAGHT